MKNTIKFGAIILTSGSAFSSYIPWSGGRGWLNVAGTFSGAGAEISIQTYSNGEGGTGSLINTSIPGVPTFITAAGVYPFEAPKGFLSMSVQATGAGDTLALTELEIIDVNPEG